MQVSQQPQPGELPPGSLAPQVFTPRSVANTPEAVLKAARAQREELSHQLERLEDKRRDLAQELRQGAEGENRQGIERRISEIDQRISDVEKQIAAADLAVAKAAAIPGAVVEVPPRPPDPAEQRAEMLGVIGGMLIFFVLFPLTIAYARRLWRRSAAAVSELPRVIADRLTRLDQAVDAIAIEVERISEGQRFLTKVMTENGAGRPLGAGPAQPIEIDVREGVAVPRSTSR